VTLIFGLTDPTSLLLGGGMMAVAIAELTKTDPELRQMLEPVEGLTTLVMQCVYGALIVVAIFGQGGMALYYHFRRRSAESYTKQTPEWILMMQRAGVSV